VVDHAGYEIRAGVSLPDGIVRQWRANGIRAFTGLDFKDSRVLKSTNCARASAGARRERNENENALPAANTFPWRRGLSARGVS